MAEGITVLRPRTGYWNNDVSDMLVEQNRITVGRSWRRRCAGSDDAARPRRSVGVRLRVEFGLPARRYDVGLELPADATVDGEVGVTAFPAMTLAEIDIAGSVERDLRALDWLYKTWLPTSGYAPDHQPGFEAWHGRPFADGLDHARLTVQLAVVAADRLSSARHDEQQ
jgi:hypothetical protein